MAKRQTKREKRANEIAEIAAQLVANVPPTMLLYVHDVMARAAMALEDAKRFMTHDDFDRISQEGDEDELFTAAYVRAAMARSAEEYAAKRGRDEAVVAILAAEQDRARERAAARERDRARNAA